MGGYCNRCRISVDNQVAAYFPGSKEKTSLAGRSSLHMARYGLSANKLRPWRKLSKLPAQR
jgi:hypothetical protein